MRLILEFNGVVHEDGAKFLVVLVDGISASRDITEYLTGQNIEVLSLDAYMDSLNDSLHLPMDFHWNEQGHKVVSKIFAEKVNTILAKE